MKVLTVLSLMQIAAIVFLYGKLSDIDNNMNLPEPAAEHTLASENLSTTYSQNSSYDAYLYPDEDRLRQIIREELSANLGAQAGRETYTDPAVTAASTNAAEFEYRRETVSQQLDYFSSVGSISDADMQKLQRDIAKLDPAGRKEMIWKLTQALNSGRLDGRL
jgi:hypothetical protein